MAHATCAIFIATTLDIGASESWHRKCFSSADSFPQNASTWAKYLLLSTNKTAIAQTWSQLLPSTFAAEPN